MPRRLPNGSYKMNKDRRFWSVFVYEKGLRYTEVEGGDGMCERSFNIAMFGAEYEEAPGRQNSTARFIEAALICIDYLDGRVSVWS